MPLHSFNNHKERPGSNGDPRRVPGFRILPQATGSAIARNGAGKRYRSLRWKLGLENFRNRSSNGNYRFWAQTGVPLNLRNSSKRILILCRNLSLTHLFSVTEVEKLETDGKAFWGNLVSFKTGLLLIAVAQFVGTYLGAAINPELAALRSSLHQRAQNILGRDIPRKGVIATRDLADAALAILIAGGDPAQAQRLLTMAFSAQNMHEHSPDYGSFRWYYNSVAVQDENADDFVAQAIGPIGPESTRSGSGFQSCYEYITAGPRRMDLGRR
jgi:hypothetical protein